jgi:hypothetical protein
MQKDVKTVKNTIERGFAYISRNLRYGGLALTLTAAFIATARPSRIIVLLTPYGGDPVVLSGVLVMMGVLSSMLGYAIKR